MLCCSSSEGFFFFHELIHKTLELNDTFFLPSPSSLVDIKMIINYNPKKYGYYILYNIQTAQAVHLNSHTV